MTKFFELLALAAMTFLFSIVALVPALFVALPIAFLVNQDAYNIATIVLALAGGFWAARIAIKF